MHKNLPTVEGVKTRFLCSITADEGTNTTLAGYVKVGGESLPMTAGGENELVAPATPAGDYLYELRAGGAVVLWGYLCARPSAFPPQAEYTDVELCAEINAGAAIYVDAELRRGPRGEKGERGEEGPRGYSAYEVACKGGFVGTEAEWLEAMRQQTATQAVRDVNPLKERAENAATKAGASETQAEKYATNAANSASQAATSATSADSSKTAAAASATQAATSASNAAKSASSAATSATKAGASETQAEKYATNAANSASQAATSATSADSSKTAAAASATLAATSESNAAQSASAAATSATQAAESAATVADAALQSGDNTFSGTNALTGSIKLANQKARSAGDFVYMQGAIMAWLVEGYSWQCNATKRDFGGLNEFAFPDDLPFPACYDVTTIPHGLRLNDIKLTKLPAAWVFDKVEGTSDGYYQFEHFFPSTLKELPANMKLDNLKKARCLFQATKILQIPAGMTLKNCTDARRAFAGTSITEIPEGMTLDNVQLAESTFAGTKIKRLPTGMTLPNATDIGGFCGSCSELEELPEGFNPPAKLASEAFLRCKKLTRLPDSFTLSECTKAGACFRETTFTTLPEGMTLEKLQDAGTAYHEGMFMQSQIRTLPVALNLKSLSNGKKMFYGCQLDRDSALRVLTTIPAHTSGDHPLTIGVHVDHQADEDLHAAIEAATAKGWTVTTQFNGTATRSTFALRPQPAPPVYVKREPSEYGGYVDESGTRYTVDWGHMVTSPDGVEPEALGYELFDSFEAALSEWGLVEEGQE